jgi:hypothetical protein
VLEEACDLMAEADSLSRQRLAAGNQR